MKKYNISTKVIHVGNEPDLINGSIIPAIYQTSTYVQNEPGKHKGYEYTRSHNPTRTRLENCLASTENAKHCIVTSSGMSSISLILETLTNGSKLLCGNDVYGGTYRLFNSVYNNKVKIKHVDTSNLKEFTKCYKKYKPDIVWLESLSNPTLQISDIKSISKLTKKDKKILVVDNTFMSPCFFTPISLGADIVVHSLTKYINGHSDIVGGAIMLNNKKIYDKLWYLQNSIGPTQSPFDSWLVLRGIKTLSIRMEQHQKNALEIAEFLERHSKILKVIYPGLNSHPQFELAKKQFCGFSGMIGVYINGGMKEIKLFLKSLKLFALAESLGGVESLIEHPAIMTHASIPIDDRQKIGITDNFVRLSVGIEYLPDLLNDLNEALSKI
tara:strand:- start:940 stop:2091 length:1152 start_codon:yes stop_codon:yes gene_type:complete